MWLTRSRVSSAPSQTKLRDPYQSSVEYKEMDETQALQKMIYDVSSEEKRISELEQEVDMLYKIIKTLQANIIKVNDKIEKHAKEDEAHCVPWRHIRREIHDDSPDPSEHRYKDLVVYDMP